MHALLTDFRNAGGDIRWMAGVHLAPPKIYALVSINNLLAHRPWLLLPQHIQVCSEFWLVTKIKVVCQKCLNIIITKLNVLKPFSFTKKCKFIVGSQRMTNTNIHICWADIFFQQLTKGEESWSLGELCQALCIMTHFHALSSFLHGSGLSTLPVRSKKSEGAY